MAKKMGGYHTASGKPAAFPKHVTSRVSTSHGNYPGKGSATKSPPSTR